MLLKTFSTQYSGNEDAGSDITVADNVLPTQVTVTVSGGQTAKVVTTYDSGNTVNGHDSNGLLVVMPVVFGNLIQRDEYDFSNNVVRSTLNHYLWQDNTTYKSNNFIKLPLWSTVYNGAAPFSNTLPACSSTSTPACVAQSKYAYDESSLASSGIGTPTHVSPAPAGEPYRGNVTTTSKWLDTAGVFVSGTATYFDTGVKATSTDPLNHITTYTYSSDFLGAYLTQTNLPSTQMPDPGAPVVPHVISGYYDFNTGLLTRFTDENGQNFTYKYDDMLRLTQGNHPDGGITNFSYPDPNTVERQRLISGTTFDDFKVKFDGLGRPYQTQQLTPECTSYIKVDTTYDSVGRAKTVSNPYCLTSEPTYGTTQTDYDALSRSTTVTKQDGSFTTIKYEDTPGDSSGAPLVCSTATDEAGKKRQACSDALGRLAKVVEPNPGAAVTTATGSVTLNGSEQVSGSSTPGSGTVTINGAEQTVCTIDPCPPHVTTGDSGTVSIMVNGVQKSVSYGKLSNNTTTLIASALASAFHNDGTAPVDATSSGAVVTLIARATGSSTNYSLSASFTYNTTLFTSPSFTTQTSGSTLTGGHDPTSDSGSVTVTINGTNYSTTYGSGDTASTIAGRLASAINAGNWASASASGATISLTSKTAGSAGNYTISSSDTWNSGVFAQPSFTTSNSGLSGGKDASALNNNPFVTTYQYNARGDLLCVHQKATDTTADVACTSTTAPSVPASWRQRFFTYDSFSRLLTAMNPELNSTDSTKVTYSYDNGGNVLSKNEPGPNQAWGSAATVTITYTYDNLNRLLDTTYSDGVTQGSSHRYDYSSVWGVAVQNPVGREVLASAANGTIGFIISYDSMGRVLNAWQCNPGVTGCKTFGASYDKVGDLTILAYPNNTFSVTYSYDSAARLTTATDSNGVIYAQNPIFVAGSAMKEFTSPNFNNNKYHVDYNNRLQPIEIWAGAGQGASALFDKQYSYGTSGSNNGNIFRITNVKDATRTQTFAYDPLNRLVTAGDNGHWANSYGYDSWGNLTNKNPGTPAGENMQMAADINNHLSGLTYDAAGNVINDGTGGGFTFDAENRIKTAGTVTYVYDAYGRRIQKSTGINYWYGPGGNVFAETDSAGNWTNYIFFGGQRLARNVSGDIKYFITDHLHSTGMFVDKAGITAAILDDNDFYPWGSVVPGVGKTTSNNTIKFTGQYRDTETTANLDYFGARYYSSTVGRFISPDWAAKPVSVPYAKFGDPQSLNLYSYVENGPINRIDPDGHGCAMFDKQNGGGGEVDTFSVSHGDSGVDADYDSITDESGNTTVLRSSSQQSKTFVIIVGQQGLTVDGHNVGNAFELAAQTAAAELEDAGNKVTVVHAKTVTEFNNALNQNGIITGGAIYFGHGWTGTLYIGQEHLPDTNLTKENVGTLSNAHLAPNATVTLNSCRSGRGGKSSIAQLVANQLQRTTYGSTTPMFFAGATCPRNSHPGENAPTHRPVHMCSEAPGSVIPFSPQ
jgi:RHS repeat-associated protein